jgi:hypothetical protein
MRYSLRSAELVVPLRSESSVARERSSRAVLEGATHTSVNGEKVLTHVDQPAD